MKLEVGKRYVTRRGEVSEPVKIVGRPDSSHPFEVRVAGGVRFYTLDGRWSSDPSTNCHLDLVKEYAEPELPAEDPNPEFNPNAVPYSATVRTFDTGATRNTDTNKLDYEGFLSPSALKSFAQYMHKHRLQADGKLRDSDNWQAGIPLNSYMKSMFRHMIDVWSIHRGLEVVSPETGEPVKMEEALCAVMFNVQGYLHEFLKET